jgi:hypothetical protein
MPIPLGVLAVAGAGGGDLANSFDLLETTVLGTTASSVTFSSLGSYSDYKHLQIRATMRANGTTLTFYRIRFNGDTGTNYARHWLTSQGTNVSSAVGTNNIGIFPADRLPGDSTTNSFTASVIDILDFSNANKNTTVKVFSGYRDAVNGGQIRLASGFWNNTAAVTSIEIASQSDNFVSGTRMSLYGIK